MSELHVLHLTEALGGGIQTLLVRLSARQVEAGAVVTVAYLERPEAPSAEVLRRQFDPRVRLLPLRSDPGTLSRLRTTYVAARTALLSQDFDILHLHSSYAGFVGRLAAARFTSPTEVMYSPHGFAFLRLTSSVGLRLFWQLVEATMARVGVCVLTCESELATAKTRLHPKRARLLRTGVDVAQYSGFRSHGSSDPPVVAMIGRICYQKAPWRFAAVARALQGRARFVWVGDGDEADRRRWLADADIEVTGWLDEDQLRKFLTDTSVLLFPTLWEGMSMALMQAQAQGVPAVVSNAVGNRDAVVHGRTGYIAATEGELVNRTEELLSDSTLRRRMSAAAASWAQVGLADDDLGSDSLALYREALSDRSPAPVPGIRTEARTPLHHRLAFFLPALEGGGAERVTLTIAQGLAARGHDVELILGERRGPLRDDIPSEVRVVDLGRPRVLHSVGALRRHLKSDPPDVLISALFHANVVAALATRGLKLPLLVVEHNTMSVKFRASSNRRERLAPLACAVAYRVVDQVGAVSEGVGDDLSDTLRLPRQRVRVLRNPIDYDEVLRHASAPLSHPWLGAGPPLVVAAGRLTPQKDFATLIHAVALLPEVRLVVLGEGEERAALTELAGSLGVTDRVDLRGFVANPYPWLAMADVIAMSSRWEGLPTVLLEALPFDARIVSTDCRSGPREILGGGRFGRLVPVGDPRALAKAIRAAAAEAPQDRSAAWARYDRAAALADYEAALDDLVLGRRPR